MSAGKAAPTTALTGPDLLRAAQTHLAAGADQPTEQRNLLLLEALVYAVLALTLATVEASGVGRQVDPLKAWLS